MTPQRAHDLQTNMNTELTLEEREEGYHWCADWDAALVGPLFPDMQEACTCST